MEKKTLHSLGSRFPVETDSRAKKNYSKSLPPKKLFTLYIVLVDVNV